MGLTIDSDPHSHPEKLVARINAPEKGAIDESHSVAAKGMLAQQTNVRCHRQQHRQRKPTTGFLKASLRRFQDLVYQSFGQRPLLTSEEGTARPVGTEYGLGVQAQG